MTHEDLDELSAPALDLPTRGELASLGVVAIRVCPRGLGAIDASGKMLAFVTTRHSPEDDYRALVHECSAPWERGWWHGYAGSPEW